MKDRIDTLLENYQAILVEINEAQTHLDSAKRRSRVIVAELDKLNIQIV